MAVERDCVDCCFSDSSFMASDIFPMELRVKRTIKMTMTTIMAVTTGGSFTFAPQCGQTFAVFAILPPQTLQVVSLEDIGESSLKMI